MQPQQDRSVVLVVVVSLALVVLAVLALTGYLIAVGRDVPGNVGTMGAVALGALAGVLATTSTRPVAAPGPDTVVVNHVVPTPPAEGIDLAPVDVVPPAA